MTPFDAHNLAINKFSQSSPERFKLMIIMVVLSILQPWSQVGNQLYDWRLKGIRSRILWDNKKDAAKYLNRNIDKVYAQAMMALRFRGRNRSIELMKVFLTIPGIGLAKAGFCCQLFAGCVGCIDRHNIRRLRLPPNILTFNKKAAATTRQKRIEAYVDACQKRGCKWLWNSWCKLIAKKYPDKFPNAEAVSFVHLGYLIG